MPMKGNRLIRAMLAVLLTAVLLLPGCAAENQGPGGEPAKEIVIPSSLEEPWEVIGPVLNTSPRAVSVLPPFLCGEWSREHIGLYDMPEGASTEGFLKGFGCGFPDLFYTKRNRRVAGIGGLIVLEFRVLKYENAEFAESSYANISATLELQDLTYQGVTLKSGIYPMPWAEETWGATNATCYFIHYDSFVISIIGRDDVAQDALDRLIEAFGVEK
jgi:hypothetical protein